VARSPRVPFTLRSRLAFWRHRRSWASRHPTTFNQKLTWKMAKDRRPLLRVFADKVAVRDYVARAAGPEVLPRLHALVSDPDELDPGRLPREFVVKPNHGSGLIWIVSDRAAPIGSGAPPAGPGRPDAGTCVTSRDDLDWERLMATCRSWLATSYADVALEWAYRGIPRRIMVEELLVGPDGGIPADYKFFVFHGSVRLVELHTNRFDGHRVNLLWPDWSEVDATWTFPRADRLPPRPEALDCMVALAEVLGAETDFVRVDLYDLGDRIVFGELTSYPTAASEPFTPESFDLELGRCWTLPRRYR